MLKPLLGCLFVGLSAIAVIDAAISEPSPLPSAGEYTGRMLVADPSLDGGYFGRTVIFVADHDASGAFGLVINRSFGTTSLTELLPETLLQTLPATLTEAAIPIHVGGPVERGAGFVLHTKDYRADDTREVGANLAVTTDVQILVDLARGEGPDDALVAIGYAGWSPGQLESEIARGSWTVVIPDKHLIFRTDRRELWTEALQRLGEDI